jgi:hypothetical protein
MRKVKSIKSRRKRSKSLKKRSRSKNLKNISNIFSDGNKIIVIKDEKLAKMYQKKLLKNIKESYPNWMKKYVHYKKYLNY